MAYIGKFFLVFFFWKFLCKKKIVLKNLGLLSYFWKVSFQKKNGKQNHSFNFSYSEIWDFSERKKWNFTHESEKPHLENKFQSQSKSFQFLMENLFWILQKYSDFIPEKVTLSHIWDEFGVEWTFSSIIATLK